MLICNFERGRRWIKSIERMVVPQGEKDIGGGSHRTAIKMRKKYCRIRTSSEKGSPEKMTPEKSRNPVLHIVAIFCIIQ
jgi:hypothetical protein